jgi:hypothetical protein
VKDATDAHRVGQDTVGHILDENRAIDPNRKVTPSSLFATFVEWCNTNQERRETQVRLRQQVAERGFVSRRGTGGIR